MLPIDPTLPELVQRLRTGRNVVLQAPPGAGKTTRVPLALLDEPWLAGRTIVMLEPRRLATRAAAHRMAAMRGERVGETVGYRMRMDSRVSQRTRIEVVTEGVLTRLLQQDPALESVGLVAFDEFHERSLNADVGLALCLHTQRLIRDDLRLLVMSATLDGGAVARLLGDAPVVSSAGRAFPVATHYRARPAGWRLERAVASAILDALDAEEGDILAFLPGAGEIRRVETFLRERRLGASVLVAPLYGNLPQAAQDAAILPSAAGRRKVVLSTSIAETSLTIEGVRIVIDSGLARVPRFSPRTGMTRLETVRVARAAADQRRGRAGRTAPGVCYRLWPEQEQGHLAAYAAPEMLEADLAPLALDLANAGILDPGELSWLDPPPGGALAQARELLRELDALDPKDRITDHGRRVAALPLHPRLAHMVLRGCEIGAGRLAGDMAALVGDRDVLRPPPERPDANLGTRLDLLRETRQSDDPSVDRDGLRRARASADQLCRQLALPPRDDDRVEDGGAVGLLLAFAYPDRIGQRRDEQGGRFLLRNGRGAALPGVQALASSPYIVVADLDDQGGESRIFLASPIDLEDLERHFGHRLAREATVRWEPVAGCVTARWVNRLGALVLGERRMHDADPDAIAAVLTEAVVENDFALLPWIAVSRQLQLRVAFLRREDASWPDMSDTALRSTATRWLTPRLYGLRRRDEVQRIDVMALLLGMLSWEQRGSLEELAPTHVLVPSGSRIPIDYRDPEHPTLAVRLQEMFGLTETPRVGGGKIPITLHLLSPAHRPVQVTQDLAGFWRTTYFDVRKDLRGRYPKHHWPDDPLRATPTNRAKRSG